MRCKTCGHTSTSVDWSFGIEVVPSSSLEDALRGLHREETVGITGGGFLMG